MGNNQCRSTGYDQESGSSDGEKSRRHRLSGLYRRLKNRLGLHGQRDEAPPSSQLAKLTLDDLFGIACIEIREAEMGFEDKWFACLSVGEQTFRTANSEQTARPVWNSGRKFSIKGLLGTDVCYDIFDNGSLVIFRITIGSMPVSGKIEQFVEIPGYLYTVNPIAVNSKYCNVFTENKRVVSIISTCFGKVAFVAIGATMVGSIHFSKNGGGYVRKGEEGKIDIEEDLLANSARSLETLVSMGMILGKASTNS